MESSELYEDVSDETVKKMRAMARGELMVGYPEEFLGKEKGSVEPYVMVPPRYGVEMEDGSEEIIECKGELSKEEMFAIGLFVGKTHPDNP